MGPTQSNRKQYTTADYIKQLRAAAVSAAATPVENLLSSASLLAPSPVGDLLGLASDAAHMVNTQEDRTPAYLAGSLLGLVPGIPSGIAKHAVRLFPAIRVNARDAAGKLTGELDTAPGQWGGMHWQIVDKPPKPYTFDSFIDDWHSEGFLDETGKYYTRGEGADLLRKHYPQASLLDPKRQSLTSEDLIELYGLPKPYYSAK